MKLKAQWGEKVRLLSICLEIGKERDKNLISLQQELKDVELLFFKIETNKNYFDFPCLIITDEDTNIVFQGSPKMIDLKTEINALLAKEKKKDVTAEQVKKIKAFFSDPEFIQFLNSHLYNKQFTFNFKLETYRIFDKNLGKVFELIAKPQLKASYHASHSEFVSNIFKKIFAQFPKDLFYILDKRIQPKGKKN